MNKIYRVLGKRGRLTIPYEIRVQGQFAPNDLLSFEVCRDGSILIQKEHSSGERVDGGRKEEFDLLAFLDTLPLAQRRKICAHLMSQPARNRYGDFYV